MCVHSLSVHDGVDMWNMDAAAMAFTKPYFSFGCKKLIIICQLFIKMPIFPFICNVLICFMQVVTLQTYPFY